MRKYLIILIAVIMALTSTLIGFAKSNGNQKGAKSGAGPSIKSGINDNEGNIIKNQSAASPEETVGAGPANAACAMSSMAVDDSSIYILRNGQLIKLNKINMQVVSSTNVPVPGSAITAATTTEAPASATGSGPVPGNEVNQPGIGTMQTPATGGSGPSSVTSPGISGNMQGVQAQPSGIGQGVSPTTGPNANIGVGGTNFYTGQNPNYNPNTSSPYTGTVQGAGPSSVISPGIYGTQIQPQTGMIQPYSTGQGIPAMAGAGPETNCPPTVSVDDANVYVLQGNQILRFDKNTLQLNSTTTLPAEGTAVQASAGAGPIIMNGCVPSALGTGPTVSVNSISNACPPAQVTLAPLGPCAEQTITSMSSLAPVYQEQMYMNTIYQSHMGAIAWSKLAAQKATKLELRRFANNVIDNETRVNNQFINWLQGWYGMMPVKRISASDAQSLRNLERLCGTNFDIAYMQDMIIHFSGAIALSNALTSGVPHCQVKNMATIMASEHVTDMNQLRTWLAGWYNVK